MLYFFLILLLNISTKNFENYSTTVSSSHFKLVALWKQISLQNTQEEFTTLLHCCIGNSWDWCSLVRGWLFQAIIDDFSCKQITLLLLRPIQLSIQHSYLSSCFHSSFLSFSSFPLITLLPTFLPYYIQILLSSWVNTWPYTKLHAASSLPKCTSSALPELHFFLGPNILNDHHICSTWKTHLHSHILNLVIPQDILTLR